MKKAKLYYDTTLLLNESVFLIDHLESFILYTQRTDVWSTSTKIIIARALCTECTLRDERVCSLLEDIILFRKQ